MQDKALDPRIVEARKWRQDQNKIQNQQRHWLMILGSLVMFAILLILTALRLLHKIGHGKNAWLSASIFWGGAAISVIAQIVTAFRQAKRNHEAENFFYHRLDAMPAPQPIVPYAEVVE